MAFKKAAALVVVLMMILTISTFAETKKITRLNVSPLMKLSAKGIRSIDEFKALVEKFADRIKEGFEKADAASIYPAFMEQVKSGTIEERIIPMGQEVQWMLFYSEKQTKVVNDVQWAGKKTINAYAVTVDLDCKKYDIIIPRVCGNVSLVQEFNKYAICDIKVNPAEVHVGENVTVDMSGSKCATAFEISVTLEGKEVAFKKLEGGATTWSTSFKVPGNYEFTAKALNPDGVVSQNDCKASTRVINTPPVCDLKVSPTSGYCGDKFTFDATGSSDKDGQVVKADFTLANKKGGEPENLQATASPLKLEKPIKKSGIYTVSLKVTDDLGAESTNSCVSGPIEVQKKLYFLAEAGPMVAKGTYTGYIFGRLGLCYLIIPEKLSFLVSGGYAVKLGGDAFKNHFLSNILLNLHFNKFFIGGGFGFSSKVRNAVWEDGVLRVEWKSNIDIVGNVGYDVFKKFNMKGSIFGELRVPIKKGLEFAKDHEILLGFRLLF